MLHHVGLGISHGALNINSADVLDDDWGYPVMTKRKPRWIAKFGHAGIVVLLFIVSSFQ